MESKKVNLFQYNTKLNTMSEKLEKFGKLIIDN